MFKVCRTLLPARGWGLGTRLSKAKKRGASRDVHASSYIARRRWRDREYEMLRAYVDASVHACYQLTWVL